MPESLYVQVTIDLRNILGHGLGNSIGGKINPQNAFSGIVRDAFFDRMIAESYLNFWMGISVFLPALRF